MLFKTKEEAKAFLEKKYPNHEFNWQEKGRRLWGLCPAHPDRNIGNFGIYFDKKMGGWGFYCFACGFSHHQFKKLSPFQRDIEIFVNDLKDQVESESQLGYHYLAGRIPDLDYYKDILFEQFEVGYHFYSRKFADEFSQEFKEKISKIDDLWEPSGKDQNYNFEWLVFIYRSLRGQPTSLKFRNIAIDKNSLRWKQHGIKTVKLTDETGIFGYRNLFAEAPVLIIVEGEFDAITTTLLTELKYPAVAVSGASGFNKSAIMQIIKHKAVQDKVIVIQPDWDTAGESALNQLIEEIPESILEGYKLYTLPKPDDEDVKDLDEYLRDDPDAAVEKIEELFKKAVRLIDLKQEKEKQEQEQTASLMEIYPPEIKQAYKNKPIGETEKKIVNAAEASKIKIDIDENFVFNGIKVQMGAIWGVVGTTSAAKTELTMDILEQFALANDRHVSVLAEFEGTATDIIFRLQKKHIDSKNFYVLMKPNLEEIEDFIKQNKDKKLLIAIDYMQFFARKLQAKSNSDSAILKNFVNKIYDFLDTMRNKYSNVSFLVILSMSKEGTKDTVLAIKSNDDAFRLSILNSIKESGDTAYDLDYLYCITFSDEIVSDELYLSRFKKDGESRKYLKLLVVKSQRVGEKITDITLVYDDHKYRTIDNANYKINPL